MSVKPERVEQSLAGRVIAVPETRELDVLASLLERRGARVLRCPLISILDSPQPQLVLAWVRQFVAAPGDDLILLTGEGLRRLMSCIEANEATLREPFIERLTEVRKIVRGPKPGRALRDIGLRADVEAVAPTTDGVIATLQAFDLHGRHVGVQLYGSDPNEKLVHFLQAAGAQVTTVAPYVYADQSADDAVLLLLQRMEAGEVDAITFTSKAQVDRLFSLAPQDDIARALACTRLAAVGPVVRDALLAKGCHVHFMPQEAYFMKPLVRTLELELGVAAGVTRL